MLIKINLDFIKSREKMSCNRRLCGRLKRNQNFCAIIGQPNYQNCKKKISKNYRCTSLFVLPIIKIPSSNSFYLTRYRNKKIYPIRRIKNAKLFTYLYYLIYCRVNNKLNYIFFKEIRLLVVWLHDFYIKSSNAQ